MKIWKISVDDVYLGVVVDKDGSFDSATALSFWNSQKPGYGGDAAEETQFLEA